MTKQAEREYAEKIDRGPLLVKPLNDPRVFREFAVVLDIFAERVYGGQILDLGCGPGWSSVLLSRAGYRVTGVDISPRMIEIARERCALENVEVEFAVSDMENFDLGRSDFDGAMFFDCLHHCPNYTAAVQCAYDHLRPGGYLLLLETTLLHRYSPHARETTAEFGVTELGFTRGQLRRALRSAGFSDITFYYDPGPFYRGFGGFARTLLYMIAGYFFYAPQLKNIVVARKSM